MNRINLGPLPILYPMPVLIIATYDVNGNPNAMVAGWGGIIDYKKLCIGISQHKTTENIITNNAFTVSIATESKLIECDFLGIVSARDLPDKFAKAGFHAIKSEFVNAPLIEEFPLTLECVALNYEHEILIGEIKNVSADESILTNGEIDVKKLKPIICDPVKNEYISFGTKIGNSFSDGKKIKEKLNII